MVLENIIRLLPEVPTKLHFIDHWIDSRDITDPVTGRPAQRKTLVFQVDRFNDKVVESTFSTMASKLADQFGPYLPTKSYVNYDFTLTQHGSGWRTSWTVNAVPRQS